jgi:hypothetical protein
MTGRPTSPFYDHHFVDPTDQPPPPKPAHPFHITGPCEAAYARGCRCPDCTIAWREGHRRRNGGQPSPLAVEVNQLKAELDAMEFNLHALREENAMLRCRLEELDQ